jgi:hypothetical protein
MEVKITPKEGTDVLNAEYPITSDKIDIVSNPVTEADTVEEVLLNQSQQLTEELQIHFQLQKVTFKDFGSSGYNEPVPSVTNRGGGELLIRATTDRENYFSYGTIPLYASAKNADVGDYRINSLKLDLLGILTSNQNYLPIDEFFQTKNS